MQVQKGKSRECENNNPAAALTQILRYVSIVILIA